MAHDASKRTARLVRQLNSEPTFFMQHAGPPFTELRFPSASSDHFVAQRGLKSNALYQSAQALSYSPQHLEAFPTELLPVYMEMQRGKSNTFTDSFCGLSCTFLLEF